MARNEAVAGAEAGAESNSESSLATRGQVLFIVSAVVSLQVVANNDSK